MEIKDTNPKDAIGDKKVALALLSPIASAHWSLAQYAGLLKYGSWNWRAAGVRSSVYLSAMKRHMDAYISGEEVDPVDGTHHLGNVMACAAILLDAQAAGKLTDDRPPSVGLRETYAFVEAGMARLKEQYADKSPRHYTIADSRAAAMAEHNAREADARLVQVCNGLAAAGDRRTVKTPDAPLRRAEDWPGLKVGTP